MAGVTPASLIHQEHGELLPHLDHLGDVAKQAATADAQQLRQDLADIVQFLRGAILPHAGVEESVLYPVIDGLLGSSGATETMVFDHRRIAELTDRVAGLAETPVDSVDRAGVAAALYGLSAVLRVHFDKEEAVYLPLLDRLTDAEATNLVEALDSAAASTGAAHAHH